MPPRAIISYDDTAGDHDALMLGRTLAHAGASLTLAYVRHSTQSDRSREQLEEHDGSRPCSTAARSGWTASTSTPASSSAPRRRRACAGWPSRRTPTSSCSAPTTGRRPDASRRSTPPRACSSASHAAVAIAPADYCCDCAPGSTGSACWRSPATTRRWPPPASLADSFGATLTRDERQVDLLVVGSRLEAPAGPRAAQRAGPERDRERHLPGAGRAARRDDRLPGRAWRTQRSFSGRLRRHPWDRSTPSGRGGP